jgi:hypothetical protein
MSQELEASAELKQGTVAGVVPKQVLGHNPGVWAPPTMPQPGRVNDAGLIDRLKSATQRVADLKHHAHDIGDQIEDRFVALRGPVTAEAQETGAPGPADDSMINVLNFQISELSSRLTRISRLVGEL